MHPFFHSTVFRTIATLAAIVFAAKTLPLGASATPESQQVRYCDGGGRCYAVPPTSLKVAPHGQPPGHPDHNLWRHHDSRQALTRQGAF